MIASKLTTKARTTIPQSVRTARRLDAGDELLCEIVDDHVILTKADSSGKTDDPFRIFSEWNSSADLNAHRKL